MEVAGEKRGNDPWEDLVKKLKKARVGPTEGGSAISSSEGSKDLVMQCLNEIEILEAACSSSVSSSADGSLEAGISQPTNQEDDEPLWFENELETCDTKTGDVLDPLLVREARFEEIEYMRGIGLYTKVSLGECWARTGKAPITTKWVDVNKGSSQCPDLRCRLVARDFKSKGEGARDDLYAAMPPLEAKRLLFKTAAATWGSSNPTKIRLIDVKKAHLNGKVGDDTWACIELPEEDAEPGMCGRLNRWLYGMRPAAKAWEEDYANKLVGVGLKRGIVSPTCFFHPAWGLRIVVHGDDFTITGKHKQLQDFTKLMGEWYLMTVKGTLGPGPGDSKSLRILNRTLRIEGDHLVYEADAKHARVLCEEFGLDGSSKGLDSPCSKSEVNDDDPLLEEGEVTKFRGLAARTSYLIPCDGPHRLDVRDEGGLQGDVVPEEKLVGTPQEGRPVLAEISAS
jgi:hypothetical protein